MHKFAFSHFCDLESRSRSLTLASKHRFSSIFYDIKFESNRFLQVQMQLFLFITTNRTLKQTLDFQLKLLSHNTMFHPNQAQRWGWRGGGG